MSQRNRTATTRRRLVPAGNFWPVLPQQPTRNTLQAVDEFRDRHFRRVDHHQVNVVVLPAALLQFRPKVPADPAEDGSQVAYGKFGEDVSPVPGDKDQMNVHVKNNVSTGLMSCMAPSDQVFMRV